MEKAAYCSIKRNFHARIGLIQLYEVRVELMSFSCPVVWTLRCIPEVGQNSLGESKIMSPTV